MKCDQSKHVILIEDNSDDIELIKMALNMCKDIEHVRVFQDGEQALDFLSSLQPEYMRPNNVNIGLIILDFKIPKISSIEVLKYIRKNTVTQKCPVVIFTSSNEEVDIHLSYENGANSYVLKPVNAGEFEDVVKKITEYWLTCNQLDNLVNN